MNCIIKIVGVAAVVSDERIDLQDEVWEIFAKSEVLDYLKGANLSENIFYVYFDYQDDEENSYTMLIDYEVNKNFEVPDGLNLIEIDFNHESFEADDDTPEAIEGICDDICEDESKERAFIADFEIFNPRDNCVIIYVGYKERLGSISFNNL